MNLHGIGIRSQLWLEARQHSSFGPCIRSSASGLPAPGLDAEGSALLNDVYEGREVGEARMKRMLSLVRLEFAEPSVMLPSVAGRPVDMALAMTEAGRLKLKPQNLLVNLPLAERA